MRAGKLCLSLAGIGFDVRRIDGEEPVTAGPLFESLQKQWLRDNPDKKPADFSLVLQPSDCFLASPSYETTSCVTVRQPLLAVEKIEIAGHGFYKVLYALAGFAETMSVTSCCRCMYRKQPLQKNRGQGNLLRCR